NVFPIDWTIFPGECVRVGNAWQFRAVCVWVGKTYLDDESQKFGLINVCGSGIGVRAAAEAVRRHCHHPATKSRATPPKKTQPPRRGGIHPPGHVLMCVKRPYMCP
ncbi:hypothetical protein M5D96_011770, partial [Drosophila gunungcola]